MLLKPDKLPSLTPVIGPSAWLYNYETIRKGHWTKAEILPRTYGFINKHQTGFRKAKSTDDHLFRLSQSILESFTEENM